MRIASQTVKLHKLKKKKDLCLVFGRDSAVNKNSDYKHIYYQKAKTVAVTKKHHQTYQKITHKVKVGLLMRIFAIFYCIFICNF